MIQIEGLANVSHDPKVKLPAIGSSGAIAAAERTITTGEIAELREVIVRLTARVEALEASQQPNAVIDAVTESNAVTVVTAARNAPKLTPAEKQRAYRERQKAKS